MPVRRVSRGRVGPALAILLLLSAVWTGRAEAGGTIHFDGSPGTAAPPATLGGYTMTPFAPDGRPPLSAVTAVPSPLGGELTFSHTVGKGRVGQTWNNWSHGYAGDVYHNTRLGGSPDLTGVTMTMPANTAAFYFYAETNLFGTFTMSATAQDGTTSGPVQVTSPNGATYFGFYGTDGDYIESIAVSNSEGDFGFAVGEFGIAAAPSVGVRINDDAVPERDSGLGTATFWVTLTKASGVPVTMSYKTSNLTATAPSDYRSKSGTVTFAPGETRQAIKIRVVGDADVEPDETFTVTLSQLQGYATFVDNAAVGTIRNDD